VNGALDQLDRLTAGFAATVVEESRSVKSAARAVTGALEGAAVRLGVTLPAAVASMPPVALQAAVPPPAGPGAREAAAAVLLAVSAGVTGQSPGGAPPAALVGPSALAPEPPRLPPAALPLPAPSFAPPAPSLPPPAAPLPLAAATTRLTGEQPFLASVDIAAAPTGVAPSVAATRAASLPSGALPVAAAAPPPAARAAAPASGAIAVESVLPLRGPRPLGVVVPETAPAAAAPLVERITAPAAPSAPAPAGATGPLTVNGGVNVTMSAQTIDMDNAEATARIIATHVAEEIDRLTERDRFRRGLPTTSTA
jgi:hypothetical protein